MMRILFLLYLACFSALSGAGEIKYAKAEHEGKEYRLNLTMEVDAGQEDLVALLSDHDNFHQLSAVMSESGLVPDGPEDATRRRLVVKTCIVFFCFKVVMVEDVEQFPEGRLVAVMVPEQSDFKSGRAEWHVKPLGPDRSEIVYSFSLQPDFWIPPGIGPFILKRKMIKEAKTSILNMERLAEVGYMGSPISQSLSSGTD